MRSSFARPVALLVSSCAAALACSSQEFTSEGGAGATSGGRAGSTGGAGGESSGASGGAAAGGASGAAGGIAGGGGASGGTSGAGGSGGASSGGVAGADAGFDASAECTADKPFCVGTKVVECSEAGRQVVKSDCATDGKICVAGACDDSCELGSAGCACLASSTCLGGLVCLSSVCTAVDVPDPLAHWAFNGDLTDSSGNGYDATEGGTVTYDVSTEQVAAVFNVGNATVASFAEPFRATLDAFTLSVRLRLDNHSQEMAVFGLNDSAADSIFTNKWLLNVCPTGLCDGVGTSGMVVETEAGDAGSNAYAIVGPLPTIGEWTHLVLVVEGNQLSYYQDGESVSTVFYVPAETLTPTVYIGGTNTGSRAVQGAIDDIQVFDHVLTDSQVLAVFAAF